MQKEQFLRYRKTTLGDSRDVFAERLKLDSNQPKSRGSIGPSAFSHIPNVAAVAMVSALNRNQQTPGNNYLSIIYHCNVTTIFQIIIESHLLSYIWVSPPT